MSVQTKTKFKPLKTIEIEVAIARWFNIRQNIIVPNISWGLSGLHECDLFVVKRSGVAVEIEIKISKADLLKDFEKKHNHVDIQHRITEFYYAFPVNIYERVKHLIPENAGVIVCERYLNYNKTEKISVSIIKKATKIKGSRKLTVEEQFKVARLGTMRIWTLKERVIKLSNKNL